MKNLKYLSVIIMVTVFFFTGCMEEDKIVTPTEENFNTNNTPTLLKVGRTQVWADCELFNSIVTPATFKEGAGNFDQLYAAGLASFKDGIGLISEAKPGDQDYNGGRWHLNVLKESVDPNKYSEACSAEDLDLNDFVSTDRYFECPLLPRRGNH